MTRTACALTFALLMVGAACGGGDGDASDMLRADADAIENDSDDADADPDAGSETDPDAGDTLVGFGDLVEGSFVLVGASEDRFDVGDERFAFRTGGGCDGSGYGFSVHVNDPAGTTTYAIFEAQGPDDLSGGVTGEFDAVDFSATVFPDGDMTVSETYSGPIQMTISEHETGGATADLDARRMTVALRGSVPSDTGDVDVDTTFRWVMGCP